MAGPERTFIVLTLPSVSTTASMLTLPAIRCVRATGGYIGGTDLIRRAGLTSPPTGRGADGSFVLPDNEESDSAPGVGTPVVSEGSASPPCCACTRLTSGAERWTSPRLGFFGCSTGASFCTKGAVFFGTVAGAAESTLAVEFLAGCPETGERVAAGGFETVGTAAGSGLVVGRLLTATV